MLWCFCKVLLIPGAGPAGKDLQGLWCNQRSLALHQGEVSGSGSCFRSERASVNVSLLLLISWFSSFCYLGGREEGGDW